MWPNKRRLSDRQDVRDKEARLHTYDNQLSVLLKPLHLFLVPRDRRRCKRSSGACRPRPAPSRYHPHEKMMRTDVSGQATPSDNYLSHQRLGLTEYYLRHTIKLSSVTVCAVTIEVLRTWRSRTRMFPGHLRDLCINWGLQNEIQES